MPRKRNADGEEVTATTRVGQLEPSPNSVRDRACLIVLSGVDVGRMYRIDPQRKTVLGRSSKVEIRLEDDLVSRKHACIRFFDGELVIEDLKSANGMHVNGARVSKHVLHDGDKIQLGATTILKFTFADDVEESFQRQMYDAALRDGLTGAFNKVFFHQRMAAELAFARRHGTPLSLLLLDLDHFKQVNDTHGHLEGDRVLAQFGRTIAETLRTEDAFARFGGEEFAVICRGIALSGASVVAERIRRRVEEGRFGTAGLRITTSIGVAAYPDIDASSGEALIDVADVALLDAKKGGRNRVVVARKKSNDGDGPPSKRAKVRSLR